MARHSPTPSVDDQDYYPLHEEDDGPEIPPHRRWVTDLSDALEAHLPGWFITGNVCICWERGNTKKYRAPDLMAVREPLTEEVHRVYLTWQQPPVTFVAEVGKDQAPGARRQTPVVGEAGNDAAASSPVAGVWRRASPATGT